MIESDFIEKLRLLATDPAARGLLDDAAVLEVGGQGLVLTHDMLVEGVHYLPDDPPEAVAWKLVAVNASDLAAKGAAPVGALLGFALGGDDAWECRFVEGLGEALAHFGIALLGGDTVAMPNGAPRTLGLTAIGTAPSTGAPSRSGAKPGDSIYVGGSIGDAGAGLAILQNDLDASGGWRDELVDAYRRPRPDLALGRALAPLVTAMADISDGLLIDAGRIAGASGCAVRIDLAAVPLSSSYIAVRGDDEAARLAAATAGDDYRLLFTVDPVRQTELVALGESVAADLVRVGRCEAGEGIALENGGRAVPLPKRLGHEHRASSGA